MTAKGPGRREAPATGLSSQILQELEQAIAVEHLNVLISGDETAQLDECAKALLDRLRRRSALQIAVVFDMSRELIVDRFNALVESMPVEQARSAPAAGSPVRVWLIHVQSAQSESQARLLLRLTQDFPGASLRLVILAPPNATDALTNELGRRQLAVFRLSGQAIPATPTPTKPPPPAAKARFSAGRLTLILFGALIAAIAIGWGLHLRP